MNIDLVNKIKKENINIKNYSYEELCKLPLVSGIIDLNFNGQEFRMLNIENDDYVPLSYLWRESHEIFSLDIWYKITRQDSWYVDIGSHTGLYSIIGNLEKNNNNIISFEPYFMNFSRLITNLRLNNVDTTNCFMCAISDNEGSDNFKIVKPKHFHSQGGFISNSGNFLISKKRLDNFDIKKKISGIKIDTEGHEYQVLLGSINLIKKYIPDMIIELNKLSFSYCYDLLKKLNYKFYFIDEKNRKLEIIDQYANFNQKKEGINALVTTDYKIERFLDN